MILRSVYLLLLTLLQIILFLFRIIVFLSIYKEKKLKRFAELREKKRQMMLEEAEKMEATRPLDNQRKRNAIKDELNSETNVHIDFEYQWKMPIYAFEFFVDIFFMPMVLLTAILRPWTFGYYFKVIDDEYNFKRSLIIKRLLKAILFYICLAISLILLPLYMHRLRWLVNTWNTMELSEE